MKEDKDKTDLGLTAEEADELVDSVIDLARLLEKEGKSPRQLKERGEKNMRGKNLFKSN